MQLVGLRFTAAGQGARVAARSGRHVRFPRSRFPPESPRSRADFDYLSPPESFGGGYGEGPNAHRAPRRGAVEPAGAGAARRGERRADLRPSVILPAGWEIRQRARGDPRTGDRAEFAALSLTALVDSPLLAGEHFRSYPVAEGEAPVRLSPRGRRRRRPRSAAGAPRAARAGSSRRRRRSSAPATTGATSGSWR